MFATSIIAITAARVLFASGPPVTTHKAKSLDVSLASTTITSLGRSLAPRRMRLLLDIIRNITVKKTTLPFFSKRQLLHLITEYFHVI
jgi:hypothetical protein